MPRFLEKYYSAVIIFTFPCFFIILGMVVPFPEQTYSTIALEMYKIIIEIDGVVIGFFAVAISLLFRGIHTISDIFHRYPLLMLSVASIFLIMLSILISFKNMSELEIYGTIKGEDFRYPIIFMLTGFSLFTGIIINLFFEIFIQRLRK